MAARLTPEQWQSVRTVWEYDPDEPSLTVAAERAAKKHKFTAPNKSSLSRKMEADVKAGQPWERRASLNGINKAAHRKADGMVDSGGNTTQQIGRASCRESLYISVVAVSF